MPAKGLINRIEEDLEVVWGEMASYFVNKRMNDLELKKNEKISYDDAEMVIKLLGERTFPFFMSKEVGRQKIKIYMGWLDEERPRKSSGLHLKFQSSSEKPSPLSQSETPYHPHL